VALSVKGDAQSVATRARALAIRLDGSLIPAVPVPRLQDGAIDVVAHHAYAEWMAKAPIKGVAVWAHTGRGLHLTGEQRDRILRDWRRALPGDATIVAGCGVPHDGRPLPASPAPRTDEVIHRTVAMADEARHGGADALLVHPPSALGGLTNARDRVLAVHEALASVGLPVIVFLLYQRASGLEYDDDLLSALLALDHVVGLKIATLNSVMRVQDVMQLMTVHYPDRLRITGEDRFLGYSLTIGARAALIGMGAARPALQARLVTAAVEGDDVTLQRLTRVVDRFAAATFVEPMEGYILRMLWALAADGIIPDRACHDPHGPALLPDDRERVLAALHEMERTP
jgi:4-hydroxy-tetrahydrodipicolinate synthase